MKVKFSVNCLGFTVGGHYYTFELNIDDKDIEGFTQKEIEDYVDNYVWEHIQDQLDYSVDIERD